VLTAAIEVYAVDLSSDDLWSENVASWDGQWGVGGDQSRLSPTECDLVNLEACPSTMMTERPFAPTSNRIRSATVLECEQRLQRALVEVSLPFGLQNW